MKMMKMTAIFIAVLFLVISIPEASGLDDDKIDSVIREFSDYLNTKIPKGNKVVFLNIKSDWPDFSEYILSGLTENAVNDDLFIVVDRQQLDDIRKEQNFQWSGEVSDASAQKIGQILGAQIIVSGLVTEVGNEYRIQVRALLVQNATVQGQLSRNVGKKEKIVMALTTEKTKIAKNEEKTRKSQASRNNFLLNSGLIIGGFLMYNKAEQFSYGAEIGLHLFRFITLQTGVEYFKDVDTVNRFYEPSITQTVLQIPVLARITFPFSFNDDFIFYSLSVYAGLGINKFLDSYSEIKIQSASPLSFIAGGDLGVALLNIKFFVGYQFNRDLSDTVYDYGNKLGLNYLGERSRLVFGIRYFIPFRRE